MLPGKLTGSKTSADIDAAANRGQWCQVGVKSDARVNHKTSRPGQRDKTEERTAPEGDIFAGLSAGGQSL